jgi:hypothetical protein
VDISHILLDENLREATMMTSSFVFMGVIWFMFGVFPYCLMPSLVYPLIKEGVEARKDPMGDRHYDEVNEPGYIDD